MDFKKQRLLVIAPHPDDDVIGCGGLIAKIKDAGGKVYVLFLTVGDTRDFTKEGLSTAKERIAEIEAVAKFLKYDDWDLAFKGNDYHLRLDTLGQKALMDVIERESKVAIEKVKPTIIAFTSPESYNQDHRIAAYAAHASARPQPKGAKHFVETVISYEEPADGWTTAKNPHPNFFVKLSEENLAKKAEAIALYKSQDRPFPNMRSKETIDALAKLRGSQSGVNLAEGFVAYRIGGN